MPEVVTVIKKICGKYWRRRVDEHLGSDYTDYIGVNISERKSGTERTKKRELVCFPTARARNGVEIRQKKRDIVKSGKAGWS